MFLNCAREKISISPSRLGRAGRACGFETYLSCRSRDPLHQKRPGHHRPPAPVYSKDGNDVAMVAPVRSTAFRPMLSRNLSGEINAQMQTKEAMCTAVDRFYSYTRGLKKLQSVVLKGFTSRFQQKI